MLVFPNLEAGNAAYKLLSHLGNAELIGPILMGMSKPVHILQMGAEVNDIVKVAAIAIVDAQERNPARAQETTASVAVDRLWGEERARQ